MTNPTSELQDEQEWARQREIRHEVLVSLTETGPVKWDILFTQFNQNRTGDIGPALWHLAHWMDITVKDNIVNITASGRARLMHRK